MNMILKQLLEPPVSRLHNISRFQGEEIIGAKETDSSHCFFVNLITNIILENLFYSVCEGEFEAWNLKSWYLKFYRTTMRMAVMHEFDEAVISTDINHTLKYDAEHGEQFRNMVDLIVQSKVEHNVHRTNNLFSKEYRDAVLTNHSEMRDESLYAQEINDDEYCLAKKVVKVADWFAFLKTVMTQTKLGNTFALPMLKNGTRKCWEALNTLQIHLTENNVVYNEVFLKRLFAEINLLKIEII